MSSSPNKMRTSPSASLSIDSTIGNKVVVVMPVQVHQHDEIFHYVFVKSSLYAADASVFGLEPQEIQALAQKFNATVKKIDNGVMIMRPAVEVINSLAQLGYRVISTCGKGETLFTLQREV